VDVYEPGPGGKQLHDLNPSDFHPTGLFWTIEIPEDGIEVNLGEGHAVLKARNVPIFDYGQLANALSVPVGGGRRTPGVVSFRVVWSEINQRVNIRNTDRVYGGFAGDFIRNTAKMEWTATTDDYTFVSAPLANSSSNFAEIGMERNGSFFS
jgi:hypothetical protein